MEQRTPRASVGRDENILSFVRPLAPDCGTKALNLVYQAAEVFSSMEDHARETEAHAQSLCKGAVEKLKLAAMRIEAAERARSEIINEADWKLQDASRALKQAQSRILDVDVRMTAMDCGSVLCANTRCHAVRS